MAEGKRYFWLKLYDDFFGSLRIKKLRRMAGGDTYVIIYLKMQLKAMKEDGMIRFKGVEENIVDELALDLDEEPDNVRVTLAYLLSCGLAETSDSLNLFLPFAVANVGSETAAAERMRKMRERNNVTPQLRAGYGDIEIEKEKEIDTEKKKGASRFTPPTVEEVRDYCTERGNSVDADRFHSYYTANGWKVGKNPMKDWKAAVRTWERDDKAKKGPAMKTPYDGVRSEDNGDDADRLLRQLGVSG